MLALRVGWLMLKVELSEEAEPLFRRTHTLLQSLFGRGSVYGNAATPGLVRCLRLRGHADEAERLLIHAAGAINAGHGTLTSLFHEDGSLNWFWRAADAAYFFTMPTKSFRVEAVFAEGIAGNSPLNSRRHWLRAELLAADDSPPSEVLVALAVAANEGCCTLPGSSPSFANLRSQLRVIEGGERLTTARVGGELSTLDTMVETNLRRVRMRHARWLVFGGGSFLFLVGSWFYILLKSATFDDSTTHI
jgi:hypothetical protein